MDERKKEKRERIPSRSKKRSQFITDPKPKRRPISSRKGQKGRRIFNSTFSEEEGEESR